MIQKFDAAKKQGLPSVTIWGTGAPRREFLFVDDMADACIHLMTISKSEYKANTSSTCSHVNAGYGSDISIRQLAGLIKHVVGYKGEIEFDETKPDGAPQKLMDSSVINSLGWFPKISLEQGLELAYRDFLSSPRTRKA